MIRRAQTGDRASFERLYRKHSGRVFGLCRRLAGETGTAEEMTQEVFVRAWQNLEKFDPARGIGPWLTRVAVNLRLNDLRKTATRGVAAELPDDDLLPGASGLPSAGAGLDLEAAIAELPEVMRTVYVMHDVEGYKHREIAEITGLASGTTKTHVHRARMRLKRMLGR